VSENMGFIGERRAYSSQTSLCGIEKVDRSSLRSFNRPVSTMPKLAREGVCAGEEALGACAILVLVAWKGEWTLSDRHASER
jgi:hypothetical protein